MIRYQTCVDFELVMGKPQTMDNFTPWKAGFGLSPGKPFSSLFPPLVVVLDSFQLAQAYRF